MHKLTDLEEKVLESVNSGKFSTHEEAYTALNITKDSFKHALSRARKKFYGIPEEFKITKIGHQLDDKGNIKSTSVSSKIAPTTDDEVREGKIVRRSTLYGADGSVTNEWIIRKPEDEDFDEHIEALKNHFSDPKNVITKAPIALQEPWVWSKDEANDLILLPLADLHLNLKVFDHVTKQEYDLSKAVDMVFSNIKKVLSRLPKAKEVILLNLGDTTEMNDHKNVTPASGHVLSVDKPFRTAAEASVHLMESIIDYCLSQYSKVTYYGVRGNHDEDPAFWLELCLHKAYKDNPRFNSEYMENFGVFQRGINMFVATHGDTIKDPNQCASKAAVENPVIFAETVNREIHSGHFHNLKVRDDVFGGFIHTSHATLAPKAKYADWGGYVATRMIEAYLYDLEDGRVSSAVSKVFEKIS